MSLDETKKFRAMMILEVLGKPAEHLTEALKELIGKIDEEKGVKVVDKKINDPVAMKKNEGFFTSFAEVEVEIEEVMMLASLMFKYMPAHIELIEPESIQLSNNSFSEILNELTRRLHGYDEVARVVQIEKSLLEKKLKALLEQNKEKEE